MLSFEIGQRESGFYSEHTDRITESPNHPVRYYYIDMFEMYFLLDISNYIDDHLQYYLDFKIITYIALIEYIFCYKKCIQCD